MALSVLVALMMLAVPLASSSNLFVDGGQTNSNGDAPVLGAKTSVGGVSIDDIKIIDDEYSYNNYLPDSYTESYKYADNIGLPWMVIYYTISEAISGDLGIKVGNNDVTLTSNSKGNTSVGKYWIAFHLKEPSDNKDKVDYLPLANGLQKGTCEIKVSVGTEHYATANFAYATNAYNVDFILNDIGGAVSLNETTIVLPADEVNKVSWYITEDKNIRAVVVGPNVTIEYLISKLAATNVIKKDGYTLDVWKDSNNVSYQNTDKLPNVQNVIAADMTVTANWNIKGDEYAALTLNVAGDITSDKTYVKAFILNGDKKIEFGSGTGKNALITSIPGISQMGYDVVKGTNVQIYEMKVTSSNGNEVKGGTVLSTDDSLTVTYKMNDVLYQKITVSSDMFNKDVILYAPANDDFTYRDIFEALQKYNGSDSELYGVKQSGTYATDNSYVTSDEYYKIIGFDGIKGNLESNKNASNEVKLDVSLNEYKVMFMVNGKFEVVSVAYGENPLDKCTLISGMTVDHWVTYSKDGSGNYTFEIFNFTTSGIKSIEEKAAKADKDKVVETFIACFYPDSQTGYAVFNAVGVSSNNNPNAYFGSEDVTEIIVTGKVGDSIPMADAPSSSKDHWLFFGWNTTNTWEAGEKDLFIAYGEDKSVVTYTAVWDDYKYAVTFYNGNDVAGVAYYSGDVTIGDDGMLTNIVGIQYDGKLYKYAANDDKFKEAYNKVLYTSKDGYNLKQWNDIDGKEAIAIKKVINGTETNIEFDVKIKEIKSDINLYAKFDPKEYTIAYNSAIAAYPNPMSQQGFVDESLKLLGDATFNNEGYKLVSWNTRADGNGTSYSLGSDFSLNGSQFEDLKDDNGKVTITLYAIWDSVGGSGSGSGSSGDNGDDNTNTYLLAGILIVIIILIIVVAVILRKK